MTSIAKSSLIDALLLDNNSLSIIVRQFGNCLSPEVRVKRSSEINLLLNYLLWRFTILKAHPNNEHLCGNETPSNVLMNFKYVFGNKNVKMIFDINIDH